MDSRLEITAVIDTFGRLQGQDYTLYPSELDGDYCIAEAVLFEDEVVYNEHHSRLENEPLLDFLLRCSPVKISKDGYYTYYKLVYPVNKRERFADSEWWNFDDSLFEGCLVGGSSVMSYYSLQKCLQYYQLKSLEEMASGINPVSCRANSESTIIRDFLLTAVYLIELFVSREDIDEALKVLDTVDTCGFNCGCITKKSSCCG